MKYNSNNKIHRLTMLSLLTAFALVIYILEMRIPNLAPIPGVKLGLANIITVYEVYRFRPHECFLSLLARIALGSVFGGGMTAFIYSLSGAVLCLSGMILIKKIIPIKYIPLSSIIGAVLHNSGQMIMAVIVMNTTAVIVYYPFLIVSGCIAGLFTGLCALYVIKRTSVF